MLSLKTGLEIAGRVWWVAPSFPQSSAAWRELKALAAQIPGKLIREDARRITLPGGGEITVKSADAQESLIGEGLDMLVLDEAAFVAEDVWTERLRPTLSDRKGGALLISTPRGRNWFWRAWMMGQEGRKDWQSWQYPTIDNPLIDAAEIDAARDTLPTRAFVQEYEAAFTDDAGAVFRFVREAATAIPQREGIAGHRYTFGVDWGKLNDSTAVAVFDVNEQAIVALERLTQIDYTVQMQRLTSLYHRFRPGRITAEANSMGEPLIEQLRRAGLPVYPFTTTAHSKALVIDHLALLIERGELRIVNDPVLIAELEAYSMERLSSGNIRYTAPQGLHDDTVIATALAVDEAGQRMNSAVGAFSR